MFLCTSRFDLEEEQAALLGEYFTRDEIEAAKEEKEDTPDEIELEPISDTEEQDILDDNEDIDLDSRQVNKDQSTEPSLPISNEGNTQVRASGRKRTRREEDGYEYHY